MAAVLGTASADAPTIDRDLADALENPQPDGQTPEIPTLLPDQETPAAALLAQPVQAVGQGGRPGFVVLNPIGVARRVVVELPDASPDLRPRGPLRGVQPRPDGGVEALVELPPFGYAWIPAAYDAASDPPTGLGSPSIDGRSLRNGVVEAVVDDATGGLRSVRRAGESFARLGQQIVVTGLADADGQPAVSRMIAEGFVVDHDGPSLVQARSQGYLADPADGRLLARFEQRLRLWTGRPVLDLDLTLSELDPEWLDRIADPATDPWASSLAVRWAWPDPESSLKRSLWLNTHPTRSARPETPEALEIGIRHGRTALLFGGLAHHRRHGPRMLDTLLIAGRESARSFRLAVALDLEHPHHAVLDFIAPAYVVPSPSGEPAAGASGWFVHLDSRTVAVTRLETTILDDGPAIVVHLIECAGKAARCGLRLARTPRRACQTDDNGDRPQDLPIEDQCVRIDLTAHEMARVELYLP
jgi:alpha-mannosidase